MAFNFPAFEYFGYSKNICSRNENYFLKTMTKRSQMKANIILCLKNVKLYIRLHSDQFELTDSDLKTKGSPDILLLAMMMWVNLLPTVVTKSDKQVLETALLELQDEGWKNKKKIKLLF